MPCVHCRITRSLATWCLATAIGRRSSKAIPRSLVRRSRSTHSAEAKSLAISEEAKKIAWKAQQRLHKRYQAMAARGKNKNQIVTALGRELLGFIWAIAIETEKQYQRAKAV